jgi:competence protein ComEC
MNNRFKWLVVILAAILAFSSWGCANRPGLQTGTGPAAPLVVKVLDVGQGDAILIRTPEQTILVDTGDTPAKEKVVSYIKRENITSIDKVIITHPHADHLGGIQAVLENFPVKQIYDSGQVTTSGIYKQYLKTVQNKKISFSLLEAGSEMGIGQGISLKVLAPEKPFITGSDSDLNNNSIVLKLVYGGFSMLLTGDAEKESEKRMVKRFSGDLKSTILKSGHHGSSSSSSTAFLKAVAPDAVIISLGANNEYHHPHPSTIKRYEQQKLKMYRTDQDGTVTIASDGVTYSITKEKQ